MEWPPKPVNLLASHMVPTTSGCSVGDRPSATAAQVGAGAHEGAAAQAAHKGAAAHGGLAAHEGATAQGGLAAHEGAAAHALHTSAGHSGAAGCAEARAPSSASGANVATSCTTMYGQSTHMKAPLSRAHRRRGRKGAPPSIGSSSRGNSCSAQQPLVGGGGGRPHQPLPVGVFLLGPNTPACHGPGTQSLIDTRVPKGSPFDETLYSRDLAQAAHESGVFGLGHFGT